MKPLLFLLATLAACTDTPPNPVDGDPEYSVACEQVSPSRPQPAPQLVGGPERIRTRLMESVLPPFAGRMDAEVIVGGRGRVDRATVVSNTGTLQDSTIARILMETQWAPSPLIDPAVFRCRVSVFYGPYTTTTPR